MMLFTMAFIALASAGPLSIVGGQFSLGGKPVFLNGINQAWHDYARDFGNGKGSASIGALTAVLDEIKNSGGNSVRIWLHVNGQNTPHFANDGSVDAMDESGTLIADMTAYLDAAQARNILVFWTLWNGADIQGQTMQGLITVEYKLTSYINNALKPMVNALKAHPAMGGWDIMNEPEGSLIIASDANPCWDTQVLSGQGPPWVLQPGQFYMKQLQNFIAKQSKAIHEADPTALVTVGSWSERSYTANMGWKNFYSDECLSAFGDPVDFPQIHTYDYAGAWSGTSPFQKVASDFGHSKPLVIGEFASVASTGMKPEEMYRYAKEKGYAGAWGWQAFQGGHQCDTMASLKTGMSSINNTYGSQMSPTPAPHTSPTSAPPTSTPTPAPPTSTPTPAPHTSAPTPAPHTSPTPAPHTSPTPAPHTSPTPAPHTSPTLAPPTSTPTPATPTAPTPKGNASNPSSPTPINSVLEESGTAGIAPAVFLSAIAVLIAL